MTNQNDVQIIPIGPDENQAAIAALIERRQSFKSLELATMPIGAIDDLARSLYGQAASRGIIVLINLAIRELGKADGNGVFVYEDATPGGLRVTAHHDAETGFTSVKVGQIVALRNDTPGHERLLPGDWINRLYQQQKSRAEQIEWAAKSEQIRRRGDEIADFTANI